MGPRADRSFFLDCDAGSRASPLASPDGISGPSTSGVSDMAAFFFQAAVRATAGRWQMGCGLASAGGYLAFAAALTARLHHEPGALIGLEPFDPAFMAIAGMVDAAKRGFGQRNGG